LPLTPRSLVNAFSLRDPILTLLTAQRQRRF
jgi:hypothetical protein